MMTSNDAMILGIFAKQPIFGQAKTRLAQAATPEWGLQVAEAMLLDTLDRCATVPVCRTVVYAPIAAREYFAALTSGRYELLAQADGDLGPRLQCFVDHVKGRGFTQIVVVGTDSPTLPLEYIENAFEMLNTHDVVIGPAHDGGYYLIGCGTESLPLFEDIPWSTANVLEKTIEQVGSWRLALLPPWYDIDTREDWQMMLGHIKAMRAAGLDPGVPRVERVKAEKEIPAALCDSSPLHSILREERGRR